LKENIKQKSLNIVSFDVPYPPNYGGVIDVFYKLKNLSKLGVNIYLHTYEYGRGEQKELEKHCKEVYYYSRKLELKSFFSRKPFIVKTRNSKKLINNLDKNDFPILFEGLHTTYPLLENTFDNRKILIRTHNIEHAYYDGLKNSENDFSRKFYFGIESKKLKNYESILNKAHHILSISPLEHKYFKRNFGEKSIYIPVFYNHKAKKTKFSEDKFALWHGDLRVSDNMKSVYFCIEVFADLNEKLIIASSHVIPELVSKINEYKNIEFVKLDDFPILDELFEKAQMHILYTSQKTGIKLRLLNVLNQGKFVIANSKMIEDTGLEKTSILANSIKEYQKEIEYFMSKEFHNQEVEKRKILLEKFNPIESAKKIIKLLD
jgi:hypothetical protein